MKETYNWNYNIKIKTKLGTYEYEDKLENIEKILEKHKEEEDLEVKAKKKVKKIGTMDKKPRQKNIS